jgi:5-carboxymethyl-2-hydroxymuconate isomerase
LSVVSAWPVYLSSVARRIIEWSTGDVQSSCLRGVLHERLERVYCRIGPSPDEKRMPHLIVEYSSNLDAGIDIRALIDAVHQAALETGVFPLGGVRTRAERRDVYKIADGHPDYGFIHVQARIGAGRPPEVRQKAAEHIFTRLKELTAALFAKGPVGLSFEMVEMDPVGGLKLNTIHDAIERKAKA